MGVFSYVFEKIDVTGLGEGFLYPTHMKENAPQKVEIKFRPRDEPDLPDMTITCENDKGACDTECRKWFDGDKGVQLEPCLNAVRTHFERYEAACVVM
eukprot:CAMPEP_0178992002 /NCGR_PEP_ID=MMETSP0795-20121207/5858_1 /TAXON_ID=88552 /ORGANISM="Amoebophrya sp., Strain Ameob2" /LENGTH=97 /DNA_ID=CAMNT_0020683807 /DNA_START=182 /DNA_END=475 /DNA_ORIENTATION=-